MAKVRVRDGRLAGVTEVRHSEEREHGGSQFARIGKSQYLFLGLTA